MAWCIMQEPKMARVTLSSTHKQLLIELTLQL